MQFKPHKKYRHTLVVGGVLLAIALCFVLFANMGWGYLWLNQLGTIGSLSALIFLAIRYILNEYIYLFPESRDLLEIRRITGKTSTTLLLIGIRSDDQILPYTKGLRKSHKLAYIENCTASLLPEESYLYICTLDGKRVGVRLECKEDFVELLKKAIEEKNCPDQT